MSNGFDGAAKKVPLKVGDSKMLMFYYDTTIDYFQRPSCCAIIEAVIKSTKPRNWWPSGITNVSIEDLSKQGMFFPCGSFLVLSDILFD